MLIGHETFRWCLRNYRVCWLSGRFSGGKTSLAFRMAAEFLKDGEYRLLTNCRCVWADDVSSVTLEEDGMLHAVIVLDEGGEYFDHDRQVAAMIKYAAKMDYIFIIPSFNPPARRAKVVTCQPVYSLRAAGIPLIVYRWSVNMGQFKDTGTFLWWMPDEIYGIYSREDPGDTAQEIVNHVEEQTKAFRRYHGRTASVRTIVIDALQGDGSGQASGRPAFGEDEYVSALETRGGQIDDLLDASNALSETLEHAEAILTRKASRRRF